ncbi:hypothetical protein OS190_16100 [Sulfitobacter sp. F26204]|uniref:hypothetical protein n=1 Tax=Sulfitobacter sp. F26204 TaxID=2996014 RepID=UPI00225E6B26|nr:hypothetical protein [Sulfitobacter sp. F26204]MCX7561093.1 hypothetical protein [Sulfitobacter sp. F26204]
MAFEAFVAIDLARFTQAQAQTQHERGAPLNNLGIALLTLGQRETGTTRLDEAVTAFRNALLEWTREAVPFNWAMVPHCLSGLELALFEKTTEVPHLDKAMEYAFAAREVYDAGQASHYVEWIDGYIAEIKSRRP